ncbi:MAG: phosphoglycerate kinase [Candidatus Methanomethylophilus sp.]|nr:phosphoglycerate kinase [Methanomethylophilus sp.]MBQ4368306.1 phosphoglycerate kinase [Methanomethylophilus sp.]MBQ4412192.1 phosphoglycerate kinase [Methanomethylophilus sp.]MBQ5397632.1 phosphoglycerate kinase [Methanomethylophilus sp.]MBQ5447834.1 phosphoglycerate kinase [Methanomethylophilus sp.]
MGAYNTLGDMNFKGKRVLLRVDINCPMDKKTLKIINDVRIRAVIPTIRELLGKKAKLVILAHQSRKGKWDFTDLSQHAQLLSKNLNTPVRYVNDVLGEEAQKAIKEVKEGEVLLLGNVRELDSESKSLPMEEHAKGELVTALAPLFDIYVCDAFGAAHRSQCSLVGFDDVLPSASGRLMAKEMYALETIFNNPRRPSVFILGGAKFGDVPHMIDRVLGSNTADTVIVVGLAGNAFLMARGVDIGEASKVPLQEELTEENFKKAQDVMSKYGQRILLPTDVAVEKDGKRLSVNIGDMANAGAALDIGDQSVEKFRKVLQVSKTSFMSGPAGMFEKEGFEVGTKAIMTAMVESGGLSVLGGGHTSAAAERFDLADSMSYVSTGGGALETFLLKDPLPVIVALEHSKSKFGNGQ